MQILCLKLLPLFNSFVWSLKKGCVRGSTKGKLPTPDAGSATLGCRNPGNFLESVSSKGEEEGVTTTAEPVLGGLEDSATFKVVVLCFHAEVHHGIDHVLKLVGTSHLTRLVDLTDDDSIAVMLLAVVSNHGQGTFSRLAVDVTIGVLTIIEALKAVDNHEEWLTRIGLAKLVSVLEQGGNMVFLASDEAVTEPKTFTNQLDLEEAFLCSVEEAYRTRLGELVSQGQHHGGLTRTRLTREEGYRARGKAFATEGAIDIVEARLMLLPKLLGDLKVEDVGSKVDV